MHRGSGSGSVVASAIRWKAGALVVALLACTGCEAGASADSVFTSLRDAECAAPATAIAAPYAARDLGVQECPAPPGWRVLVVASDANTWVDLSGPGVTWSGERAIVYEMPIGLFPGVDDATPVEWRRNRRGEPTAAIVRVVAQDPVTLTTPQARLFVVRLTASGACVIGRVATGDEARGLADGSRQC
jgi:hypothetical protein